MKFKRVATILCFVFLSVNLFSQENIKVMFYNLLQFPEAPPANRETILKTITDDISPDLFMVCEIKTLAGALDILNTTLKPTNSNYEMATYVSNQSGVTDLEQLVFYDSSVLTLEGQSIIITDLRDINHYEFKLNSTPTDPTYLDVFVAHLKANNTNADRQLRLSMVQDLVSVLNTIPSDHYVLLAGDLNLYSSSEPAYVELLDTTNDVVFKDPINTPGDWNANIAFADIHTQSTRTSTTPFGGYGGAGGLDSRFDFILISDNITSGEKLEYVANSYKSYGNNGNCYNTKDINDPTCSGIYSQVIRDSLYNMSDHIPIVMELQHNNGVLGVEDSDLNNELIEIVGENIISDRIHIKINPKTSVNRITIYNIMGQKVKNIAVNKSMVNNTIEIDVTYLNSGIYYLQTDVFGKQNALKFLKTD